MSTSFAQKLAFHFLNKRSVWVHRNLVKSKLSKLLPRKICWRVVWAGKNLWRFRFNISILDVPTSLATNLAIAIDWAIIVPSTSSRGIWPNGAMPAEKYEYTVLLLHVSQRIYQCNLLWLGPFIIYKKKCGRGDWKIKKRNNNNILSFSKRTLAWRDWGTEV